jgi:hypothetical protein
MKNLFTFLLVFAFGQILLGQTYYGPNYVHLNHSTNCYSDYTILDGSIIGTDTAEHIIFTHVYGPDLSHEEYMLQSHGLWYTGSEWSIFNETGAAIDTSLAFNVLDPTSNGTSFKHTVTSANSFFSHSDIDNPLLNNNPNAVFFISKTWVNSVFDTAHVGIWYNTSHLKWSIYNEDGFNPLKLNSTYNIFVPSTGTSYFQQVATNNYYLTYIDNPLLNGNPDAKIFVVHDYTNSPATEGYIDNEIGVWYDGSGWTIYNENPSDTLFTGATFNVLVIRDNPVGIENNSAGNAGIKVTPNPAKDRISVLLNSASAKSLKEIRLCSIDGQTVIDKAYNGIEGVQIVLDLSSISPGLYILTAVSAEGTLSAKVNVVK